MPLPVLILDHLAVAVAAIGGVLAARGKEIDLFGALTLGIVTALGGGTLREAVLGAGPAPWISDSSYLLSAGAAGLIGFILVRWAKLRFPRRTFLVADALALALFTATGTARGVDYGVSPIAAIALGVMTGVAGGITRDILLGQIPLVFRRQTNFYATAALCGAGTYTVLFLLLPAQLALLIAIGVTLVLRLASIHWNLMLPQFSENSSL